MTTRHDIGFDHRRPVVSGDTIALEVYVTNDENGTAQSLNGALVEFGLFDRDPNPTGTANVLITKTVGNGITLTDPTNGLMTIIITDTNTASLHGIYFYEVEIQIGTVVQTALLGLIKFRADGIL